MVERTWQEGVESAIDALTAQMILMQAEQKVLREDMTKTNEASLKENMAWSMTDRMVTQMNDLLGMQQTQIRDLVRQVGVLDKQITEHLKEVGYSE